MFSRFQDSIQARIFFVCITLVLVFLVPWWLVLILGLVGVAIFHPFPEFLLTGILFDILYGAGPGVWNLARHTIIFLAVFLVVTFIRSRIRL